MVDVLPAPSDLSVYRGDTYVWTDEFADDTTGVPLDLSGHTWLCQVRVDQDRGTVVATLTVDAAAAATGRLVRTLPADQSALLVTVDGRGTYFWDLQSTATDGTVKTWLSGRVKVRGDRSDVA